MWLLLTWWKTWENSAKFRPFRFEFHNRVSKNKQLWLNKQARHNSGTFRNVENWTEQTKMKSSNIFKVNIQNYCESFQKFSSIFEPNRPTKLLYCWGFFHIGVLRNKIMTDKHLIQVPSSTAVQFFLSLLFSCSSEFIFSPLIHLDQSRSWILFKKYYFGPPNDHNKIFRVRFHDHYSGFDQIFIKSIYKCIKCIYFNNCFYKRNR